MQVVNLLKIPLLSVLGINIAPMAWSAEFISRERESSTLQ